MAHCQFCNKEIDEPKEHDKIEQCWNCRAAYWLEFVDDLYMVGQQGAEFFDLSESDIETKVIRDFDRSLDYPEHLVEEGIEVCLVFAKPKASARQSHELPSS